jgi:hypothetical protein
VNEEAKSRAGLQNQRKKLHVISIFTEKVIHLLEKEMRRTPHTREVGNIMVFG